MRMHGKGLWHGKIDWSHKTPSLPLKFLCQPHYLNDRPVQMMVGRFVWAKKAVSQHQSSYFPGHGVNVHWAANNKASALGDLKTGWSHFCHSRDGLESTRHTVNSTHVSS